MTAAQQTLDENQVKLQNHDVTIDQISAEVTEASDRLADMQTKVADAEGKIASLKRDQHVFQTKLKRLKKRDSKTDGGDKNDVAESKKQRKQLIAQRRRLNELAQQLTVSNNQIVAWQGEAAGRKSRISDLQKETGRLKELRKSLNAKLETSRAEVNRLNALLQFWKSEAEFAKSKN